MRLVRRVSAALLFIAALPPFEAHSQAHGALALGELIDGLGVTTRVLIIGAHPDDEDNRLLAWLARGRHVETAYLSLTHGDGGQNLLGNELGEALGAIRTEELLSARRVDGGRQYFTRAFDFGFSKDSAETFRHWPRDSVLGDVVAVVRAFRPHVIVSVFSGTDRDGHGHHQVAGLLATEVYDAAADAQRWPESTYGPAWAPLKFYRGASFNRQVPTFQYNAGEYDVLLGRSYAEIAAESRSQHRSQAQGGLQRRGAQLAALARIATRVNAPADPKTERSIFDGIDTTLMRIVPTGECRFTRGRVSALAAAVTEAQRAFDWRTPGRTVVPLVRLRDAAIALAAGEAVSAECARASVDGAATLAVLRERVELALAEAAGVVIEAQVPRDAVALGDSVRVTVSVFNRGSAPIAAEGVEILPDSAGLRVMYVSPRFLSQPRFLQSPRRSDLYEPGRPGVSANPMPQADRADRARDEFVVHTLISAGGATFPMKTPIVYRYADPVKGDLSRPLQAVPAVSVTLERQADYARANMLLSRELRVTVRSGVVESSAVKVSLSLPSGLSSDSVSRTVVLPAFGAVRTVVFAVRGQLGPGRHRVSARAESAGQSFGTGYVAIEYDHIPPIRIYRDATLDIEAVDAQLPAEAHVAYIQGVGDNSAPVLQQLGVRVTMLDPAAIPTTNLRQFSAVVVGTRAYESNDALVSNNAVLLDYVRKGGTMVVQYGQFEMQIPGIMPYPIALVRPADRVTDEGSPITVVDPASRLLSTPNRISLADFEGWVQDRTLYMPRTFDGHYAAPLATHDPNEPDNRGVVLVTPYGEGTYVYTTLAFFRQLPAAVPGAARLFANLLDAKPERTTGKVTP